MTHQACDVKKIMHAAGIVRDYGERVDGEYCLDGIRFNSGYDGYSLTLANNHVSLTVNFHNTLHLNSPSRDKTDEFYKHLDRIIRDHSN